MSVFDDMTVFVRAVEVGSFSGAAQQLGITKSIVSRRILSLESRLGTSMFHRSTRRLSLTETGLAYYERARRILADVAEAEDVASQLHGDLKGRLRVAAPMSFGYRHLSPVVTDFLRAHPQVDIELDLNDRRVDLISEGFDIAVRIGSLPDCVTTNPMTTRNTPAMINTRPMLTPILLRDPTLHSVRWFKRIAFR